MIATSRRLSPRTLERIVDHARLRVGLFLHLLRQMLLRLKRGDDAVERFLQGQRRFQPLANRPGGRCERGFQAPGLGSRSVALPRRRFRYLAGGVAR